MATPLVTHSAWLASKRPAPTGDRRFDACLGALAEHLAALHGFDRPAWAIEPGRFLESFWFVSDVPGFRAIALAQAPAASALRQHLQLHCQQVLQPR